MRHDPVYIRRGGSIGFVEEAEVYQALGEEGFTRLVHAFYSQIPKDDILGPLYPQKDMEGAEKRLRGFLIFRFGGPEHYIAERGHPRLRMRHAPFPVTTAARDRWMELMERALGQVAMPAEAKAILQSYFVSTAQAMVNRG